MLLVGGTADPYWDGVLVRKLSPHVLEVEGADHGMYVEGPLTSSIAVLGQVVTGVEEFLAAIGCHSRAEGRPVGREARRTVQTHSFQSKRTKGPIVSGPLGLVRMALAPSVDIKGGIFMSAHVPSGQSAGPATPEGGHGQPPAHGPPPRRASGWTAGRIICLVLGSVLALISLGLLTGGGALLWTDQTQRQDGYVTSSAATYSTRGYALTTESIGLHTQGWHWVGSTVGKVRIHVTAPDSSRPVFLGIAPAAAVTRYLANVPYSTVTSFDEGTSGTTAHLGTQRPATPPRSANIWAAQVSGTGTQALTWTPRSGDWMLVAMMDGNTAPGLTVRADAGATIPALPWIAAGLLAAGVVVAVGGVLLIVLPIRRAQAR